MQGLAFATLAYFIWGFYPLFFNYLTEVMPLEVLAHRVIWSFGFTFLFALSMPSLRGQLLTLLKNKTALKWLSLSALLIAINWLTYIVAVEKQMVVQASLGFFISPLVTLLMGWLILKEDIHPLQLLAGVFAFIAVLWELWQAGSLPWVACILAFAFAGYGLVRKVYPVDGISGLVVETLLLLPFCVGFVGWQFASVGQVASFGSETNITALLISMGVVTALPLILFATAVRQINYSVVGFLMYINPTMQFLIAVYVLNEPMPESRWVTFGIVWFAMGLFLFGLYKNEVPNVSVNKQEA
jgi:chloramphenicol-sensitive protein RarD